MEEDVKDLKDRGKDGRKLEDRGMSAGLEHQARSLAAIVGMPLPTAK